MAPEGVTNVYPLGTLSLITRLSIGTVPWLNIFIANFIVSPYSNTALPKVSAMVFLIATSTISWLGK